MSCLLEIACFNPASGIIAAKAGADRLELCDDLTSGGITPSMGSFRLVKENPVNVFVMIRPRGGNFSYSEEEFEKMKRDIIAFKETGADGFVFGILKEDKIDIERNKMLVKLASPLPCTFHRAFDMVGDPVLSLEDLIKCGFRRVLSSGTKKTALEGVAILARMNLQARERIIILPGGNVRAGNCKRITQLCRTSEIHSSAITGADDIADPVEIKRIKQQLSF